jgi:16S rRNA (cytosine1402-N4)-methyltransferase
MSNSFLFKQKIINENQDTSVFLSESISLLKVKPDGIYVDCTLGSGGHSEKILSLLNERGLLIALE